MATRIILDSVADGVFTVDKDWNITSFNRAAERITGIPSSQAVGQKCFDILHADICQSACAMRKTLKTGKEIIDQAVNILNREGNVLPISISTAVLKDEKGNTIGGVETFRDLSAFVALKKEISRSYSLEDIISKNHEIQATFNILPDIAESESTVLLQGESGTGKELFARAIHNLSRRGKGPFVAVNCGALPDTLLESELFGYKRGAFTDAKQDKPGRFALAGGGTLFLDEIGDLPFPLQAKLLRVLQEKEYEPLGATGPVKANVRIIAATNHNLSEMVAKKSFREDLFYRLNVVAVYMPSLRERPEDISPLVEYFYKKFAQFSGKGEIITPGAMKALVSYPFPGNVRELENLIERCAVLGNRVVSEDCLPPQVLSYQLRAVAGADIDLPEGGMNLEAYLDGIEKRFLLQSLSRSGGVKKKAAALLGMTFRSFRYRLAKFGMDEE